MKAPIQFHLATSGMPFAAMAQQVGEAAVTPYGNLSGRSGVVAYEIAPEAVTVEFEDGGVYRYSYVSAGREHVERMKRLAAEGRGLSTYIVRQVRLAYEARLR